jgi:hypothetical protein
MNALIEVTKLVDAYIIKKAERLKADREAGKLKDEENALKKTLLEICVASGAKSLGGSKGTLNHQRKDKPTVSDWPAFYAYMAQHEAWELLQKRLGEAAVQERWEDGIVIPGVTTFPVDDFTISSKT